MITHQHIAEWRGKDLVDKDGHKIGKLEDVYVDFETDEPVFGTAKEGLIGGKLCARPSRGSNNRPRQSPGSSVQRSDQGGTRSRPRRRRAFRTG